MSGPSWASMLTMTPEQIAFWNRENEVAEQRTRDFCDRILSKCPEHTDISRMDTGNGGYVVILHSEGL